MKKTSAAKATGNSRVVAGSCDSLAVLASGHSLTPVVLGPVVGRPVYRVLPRH